MQMQGAGSNSTLTLQHFENRFIDFQSIDVELLGYGTAASQILQITHPVQMNGFLTVLMAEQNINVSVCCLQTVVSTSRPPLFPPLLRGCGTPLVAVLSGNTICRDACGAAAAGSGASSQPFQ